MERKVLVIYLILIFSFAVLSAAGLDETLESLSGQAAESYVGPVVSGFGTSLNGGWFHKSPKAKFLGLEFEIGVVAMATMYNDEDDHFSTNGTFQFNYAQAYDLTEGIDEDIRPYVIDAILDREFDVDMYGPTIIGPEDESIIIEFPGQMVDYIDENGDPGSEFIQQKGIDTGISGLLDNAQAIPMFSPQIALGTIFGTMLTARILPPFDVKDLGKVSYYGAGLQHNIKEWLPVPLPLDVSLGGSMQILKLGDYVTANGYTAGLNVSKTFGPKTFSITPYAGYILEGSSMQFTYDYELSSDLDPVNIDFEIEGENKSRIILGSTFRLGLAHLNVDYNIGKYNSATLGLAFAF